MQDRIIKVLIVDDEYWIRENLKCLIEWECLNAEIIGLAENGADAFKLINENKPDIVITDVNMPIMDGPELIKKVKDKYEEIIFIAISGYSDFKFVRAALLSGAVDYLLKPVVKADLHKTIVSAIEKIYDSKDMASKVQEKIKIAESVVTDRELSRMLNDNILKIKNGKCNNAIEELELKYAGFTMVLIRINEVNRHLDNSTNIIIDIEKKIYNIKELIKKQFYNTYATIFNNSFKMEEFIVITNISDLTLDEYCNNIKEKIESFLNCSLSIVISDYYFSFSEITNAYRDIKISSMMQIFGENNSIIRVENINKTLPTRKISIEHEKQLEMAVISKNKELFETVLYKDINLKNCLDSNWSFAEVRQMLEMLSSILRNGLSNKKGSEQILIFDNLSEILRRSLEKQDYIEIYSVLEQMKDEVFKTVDNFIKQDSVYDIVLQIKDYVDCCYVEEISLINLSKNFNVDSSYLSKVFKQVSGDNLMLYISKKRVEKSKEYLLNSDISITEISILVGYSDYGYFSRVFKKITGVSPSLFRENGTD